MRIAATLALVLFTSIRKINVLWVPFIWDGHLWNMYHRVWDWIRWWLRCQRWCWSRRLYWSRGYSSFFLLLDLWRSQWPLAVCHQSQQLWVLLLVVVLGASKWKHLLQLRGVVVLSLVVQKRMTSQMPTLWCNWPLGSWALPLLVVAWHQHAADQPASVHTVPGKSCWMPVGKNIV